MADMIHKAQRLIRSDAVLMRVPKEEYMQDGFIHEKMKEAGFRETKQMTFNTLVTGEELEGLRTFMLGDFTREARQGWSDEEQAKWPAAIDSAIKDEVSKDGGVVMEAWVVTGQK